MPKGPYQFHPKLNLHSTATTISGSPKKSVRLRVAFPLFILLSSFHAYSFVAVDTVKEKLDGRWEWIMTYGGYAGESYTPESEDYSLAVVFSINVSGPDGDSIGYRVYRNDSLILSGITTTTLSSMPAFGPGNLIYGSLMKISDTLELGAFILDGYSSYFIKTTTSMRKEQPCTHAAVPALPSNRSSHLFTLSGRIINTTRYCTLPAGITVSRYHTAVEGIRKK